MNKTEKTKKPFFSAAESFFDRHIPLGMLILSLLIVFVIEILNRKSFLLAAEFVAANPLQFLSNVLIILTFYLLVIYLKRRTFAVFLLSVFWLLLGIINFVVRLFRQTPFSAVDIEVFLHANGIAGAYLTVWQIVLIIAGAVAVIGGIILAFIRMPKKTGVNLKICLPASLVCVATLAGVLVYTVRTDAIASHCDNLIDAYDRYGFTACFSLSVFDKGIKQPEGYSRDKVEKVLSKIGDVETDTAERPNIIFVQLESFFDPTYLNDFTFSEDPVPTFRELKRDYPSGLLTVSTIGGGTTNTEFEVLTSMSLDYFGLGETPFVTVLRSQTCESIAYALREQGYRCTSLHNNTATFYDRNRVYSKLGFDTFIPVEYMQNVEYNDLGWAKDGVLLEQVDKVLKSSAERDFVIAITVQTHGKYPTVPGDFGSIKVSGGENDVRRCEMEYYVNQLHECDDLVRSFVEKYTDYDEPVCIVFYGDHLPALDIDPEEVSYGDIYKTEYIIWTNYDTGVVTADEDIPAYRLMPKVLQSNGMTLEGAPMINLHVSRSGSDSYTSDMRVLQYDLLYGDHYSIGGKAHTATDLRIGLIDPEIEDCYEKDGYIYVTGRNFTRSSTIYFNDWLKGSSTEYIDPSTLRIKTPVTVNVATCTVSVWQVCVDNTVFGKTSSVKVSGTVPEYVLCNLHKLHRLNPK